MLSLETLRNMRSDSRYYRTLVKMELDKNPDNNILLMNYSDLSKLIINLHQWGYVDYAPYIRRAGLPTLITYQRISGDTYSVNLHDEVPEVRSLFVDGHYILVATNDIRYIDAMTKRYDYMAVIDKDTSIALRAICRPRTTEERDEYKLLPAKIDIQPAYLSAIVNSKRQLTPKLAKKFAAVYGSKVTIDETNNNLFLSVLEENTHTTTLIAAELGAAINARK